MLKYLSAARGGMYWKQNLELKWMDKVSVAEMY